MIIHWQVTLTARMQRMYSKVVFNVYERTVNRFRTCPTGTCPSESETCRVIWDCWGRMLFADDLVFCDPDGEMMELRLEKWRECMEKNGLKVSRANTEHQQITGDTDPVRMKRYMETVMVNMPTVQSFKYLGSTIDRGGASKGEDNRVTKAWSKWRELSGVICDKKTIPTK